MRCAIYTRKSHDDSPDAQLSSVETQRDLCVRYVESQAGEGWTVLPNRYDDVGFTGSNTRRPGLTRLYEDISAGQIDGVIVYKIDRLSRSLRDFVNLIDTLDKRGVTFLSVTQSFNTTTSMGRLTLNILLTFAQFEREMIGERTRDSIAGARAKGLWTSGAPPFGYRAVNRRLVVDVGQAAVVRMAFKLFPKVGVFGDVAAAINATGHRNRRDRPFDGRAVKAMLTNRVYRGDLVHRGVAVAGNHPPIVTEGVWRKAAAAIEQHEAGFRSRINQRPANRAPPTISNIST